MQVSVSAQIIANDTMLDTLFNKRVKSLDEFMARFNGDKNFTEISPVDSLNREKNILALFEKDYLLLHQEKFGNNNQLFSDIMNFIRYVVVNGKKLDIEKDSLIFAVADMKVRYATKEHNIKVAFKYEHVGNGIFGWKITGVSGLIESRILDTTLTWIFRPVDNEMNFSMAVSTINSQNNMITKYRSFDSHIDQLSYFLALCAVNKISVIQCNSIVYHVLSIDGYAFEISEFNRLDKNNGWLISKFQTIDKQQIKNYINKLLGKK